MLHIGPMKENKTSRGQKVMRAQVILADKSGSVSSLFTSNVISIAEKAFEKEKTLRYIYIICLYLNKHIKFEEKNNKF